jgi:hypothetical protein
MTTEKLIDYDELAPWSFPIKVKGRSYLVREPSEDAAVKFRNQQVRGKEVSRSEDGQITIRSLEGVYDIEPLLVYLCTFEQYEHQGETRERPILLSVVKGWPSRVVKDIYKRIKERSPELDEVEEKPTVESLEKTVADAQSKLAKLRNGEEVETDAELDAKNVRDGGTAISSSRGS